jgi:hypothetical protein
MKIYVRKTNAGFCVTKETTFQSIISDLSAILVFVIVFSLDVAFSILVTYSFIFDFLAGMMILIYVFSVIKFRKRITTKRELHELIDDI